MDAGAGGWTLRSPGNFDGVDWTALPVTIDEIERIEVVRGTNSVAYGSNSFLGVINIITRHSADAPGAKASASMGSSGIRDVGLELGDTSETGSRDNAAVKQDDGFAGLHDGQQIAIASLRSDRRISDHDELMIRFAASGGSRELGYPDSTFNNNAERSSDSRNAALHLQWQHTPTPDDEWLLHYYRNQDRTYEEWSASAPLYGVSAVPLNRDRSSVRDNLELQHRQTLFGTLRTVWGMEVRHDQVESPFLTTDMPTRVRSCAPVRSGRTGAQDRNSGLHVHSREKATLPDHDAPPRPIRFAAYRTRSGDAAAPGCRARYCGCG